MYSVPTYMVSPKKGDFELRSNSVSLNDEIDNLDKSCSFFSLQYVFAILFVSPLTSVNIKGEASFWDSLYIYQFEKQKQCDWRVILTKCHPSIKLPLTYPNHSARPDTENVIQFWTKHLQRHRWTKTDTDGYK